MSLQDSNLRPTALKLRNDDATCGIRDNDQQTSVGPAGLEPATPGVVDRRSLLSNRPDDDRKPVNTFGSYPVHKPKRLLPTAPDPPQTR